MIRAFAEGGEDGPGLGDLGDGFSHGSHDFGVLEVRHGIDERVMEGGFGGGGGGGGGERWLFDVVGGSGGGAEGGDGWDAGHHVGEDGEVCWIWIHGGGLVGR